MNKLILMASALGLGWAGMAQAESGAFVGRWHWDAKQSTAAPGEPVPSDVTTTIADAQKSHVKWTVSIIDHRGQPREESFEGAADGVARPIQGAGPGTTAAFTLENGVLQATFKGPHGETDVLSCAVNADQKAMRCDGTIIDAKGHADHYLDVYERL